jgi:hypothetical protein
MTVERAMKRVVHHLTHLSRVWKVHAAAEPPPPQ